jgi:hypothetical protein
MFDSARPVVVFVLACASAAGCASFAKKPPTPADDIPPRAAAGMTAPPGERYYILVFGSQSTPRRPKYTHSWATAVRVTGADGPGEPAIEEHTISWMPATLDIRPLARVPETGVNLGLRLTVEEMLKHDERVSVWGPYEIGPGLFHRFLVQKQFLESGRVGYQCIDSWGEAARLGSGCDCIHAITDMDPEFDRREYPLSRFGAAASRHLVRQLHERPIIIGPGRDHGWLLGALGLGEYPLVRQTHVGLVVENTPENVEEYLRRTTSGR